jgi:DNA polymerase-1
VDQARGDNYLETIFGRRRAFPDLASNNQGAQAERRRAALNARSRVRRRHSQDRDAGVASDLDERGLASQLLLQVHDELVFEVADGELDELTAVVTPPEWGAADLAVPLEVQIGLGANWDAAAH